MLSAGNNGVQNLNFLDIWMIKMELHIESNFGTYNLEFKSKDCTSTARCFDFDRMVDLVAIHLGQHRRYIAREWLRREGGFE